MAAEAIEPAPKSPLAVVAWIGTVLSLLGIADAGWLTITHYNTKVVLACPDTGVINCAKVTTSSYSEIFHVPVALLGLLFFVTMLILQLPPVWRMTSQLLRRARLAFAASGILMIFWLIYVELFRLNAICLYCTGVHILTVLVFITTGIGTALASE